MFVLAFTDTNEGIAPCQSIWVLREKVSLLPSPSSAIGNTFRLRCQTVKRHYSFKLISFSCYCGLSLPLAAIVTLMAYDGPTFSLFLSVLRFCHRFTRLTRTYSPSPLPHTTKSRDSIFIPIALFLCARQTSFPLASFSIRNIKFSLKCLLQFVCTRSPLHSCRTYIVERRGILFDDA